MLVKLIIPLIIEQALSILVGMCDGVMVSSAGEAAISGVSLVDMINNVILKLFAALATGGAVITSQYLGARDNLNARRSAGQLVLMSTLFGVLIMALCLIFSGQLMRLFFGSISDDVMSAGLKYFHITALSFPFIALYNAGAAIFRSIGNSKVSMKVSMIMNMINVAGNGICIYGFKMGVAGVAIPTLISRAVAAILILYLVSKPENEVSLQWKSIRKVELGMMKNILRIGIPSACENGIFELGRVLVVSMIALFGTSQTSANAVANNLDAMGVIVGQAMNLAMITVIGQCVGARDAEQVIYYMKKLMLIVYVVQGACNLLICAFLPQLIGLYSSLSTETEELATKLVLIHALCGVVLWPASFVLPNALRAANDAKFTMIVSIASMFCWRISLSYLLCVQMEMGALGVWIAMVVDWICRTSFFVGRTVSGKWKKKCGLA
ncbi:MAG: MATE family efflux transporter [Oscillospiraceae bacterium]|nr:MATE family efflux transporter [Oscillospiraceae bacterium]